ncbi:RNA-directed DNA polymerase, eukaryota, Reverse transcriptase zinc-binding domain protein [Artemisia annua]|uniref:RNA-directed DNA polymerase, eukaryota, Reverse transcriptase zinc-binding domain protein n=1 Tax=Artemisia annua TaxID=35608 RepID=A0A2U1NV50_ARTAN|nr:RNA-directed DNA polymerase, eukaryota, Reverse transcriptase zinc-binding domain protein [Artemisia annua]
MNDSKSHSHLFFSCTFSKRLWERLKPIARLDNVGNDWANVISVIVNKPATNTIWSVIQRLILGASVYYIWNERNIRKVEQVYRSEDGVFKCITDCVRLKLMGLNLKHTSEVLKAAEIWNIPIRKNEFNDNTGFWECNTIYLPFIDDEWCSGSCVAILMPASYLLCSSWCAGSVIAGMIVQGRSWRVLYSFCPSLWFYPLGFT